MECRSCLLITATKHCPCSRRRTREVSAARCVSATASSTCVANSSKRNVMMMSQSLERTSNWREGGLPRLGAARALMNVALMGPESHTTFATAHSSKLLDPATPCADHSAFFVASAGRLRCTSACLQMMCVPLPERMRWTLQCGRDDRGTLAAREQCGELAAVIDAHAYIASGTWCNRLLRPNARVRAIAPWQHTVSRGTGAPRRERKRQPLHCAKLVLHTVASL